MAGTVEPSINRARLRQELEIGRRFGGAGAVVRPLSLEPGGDVLVLERFAGRPLAQMLGERPDIETYLRLARAMADAVAEVHEAASRIVT